MFFNRLLLRRPEAQVFCITKSCHDQLARTLIDSKQHSRSVVPVYSQDSLFFSTPDQPRFFAPVAPVTPSLLPVIHHNGFL